VAEEPIGCDPDLDGGHPDALRRTDPLDLNGTVVMGLDGAVGGTTG